MVVFLIIFHICMPIISVLKPTHLLICIHVLLFFYCSIFLLYISTFSSELSQMSHSHIYILLLHYQT